MYWMHSTRSSLYLSFISCLNILDTPIHNILMNSFARVVFGFLFVCIFCVCVVCVAAMVLSQARGSDCILWDERGAAAGDAYTGG